TDPGVFPNSATDTDTQSSSADLGITKTDGSPTYTPGAGLTYTIVATNHGPSNVTDATVSDSFDAALGTPSWTAIGTAGTSGFDALGTGNISDSGITIPSGGSVTYTVNATVSSSKTGNLVNTATVSSSVTDPGVFPNSATDTAPATAAATNNVNHTTTTTASSGVTDVNAANNTATDTDTQASSANLAVSKTDGVATYTPGGSTTYTITFSNAGPSNVTGATIADSFPAAITSDSWTCVAAGGATCTAASGSGNLSGTINLPVGGTATYTVTASISSA